MQIERLAAHFAKQTQYSKRKLIHR
jgi:hypothetical protein